jgi:hypothetical protein
MYPLIGSLGFKIESPWSILRAELFIKEEDKVSYEVTPGKRFLAGGLLSIDGHKKGSERRGKTNEEKLSSGDSGPDRKVMKGWHFHHPGQLQGWLCRLLWIHWHYPPPKGSGIWKGCPRCSSTDRIGLGA